MDITKIATYSNSRFAKIIKVYSDDDEFMLNFEKIKCTKKDIEAFFTAQVYYKDNPDKQATIEDCSLFIDYNGSRIQFNHDEYSLIVSSKFYQLTMVISDKSLELLLNAILD